MRYPIGIQSFETIRQRGFVYVDKTDFIYELAQGHVYFLARPRRFGKSLLLSTLKCYFEGRRDLFEGLKIMELEQEWAKYPVVTFDFNGLLKSEGNPLRNYLFNQVKEAERKYGITPEDIDDLGLRFRRLIPAIHEKTGQQVVVLIDEYDKPLLDLLETGNPEDEQQLIDNRELLRGFFSIFKATDDHLRFVMLTGITKFSQVSMFSGFNQPDDITLDRQYDTLLGITEQELHTVFAEPIREMAEEMGCTEDEVKAKLKAQYDGYHFSDRMVDVYNPFSIINAFAKRQIKDYWFASGTPSYMVRLLSKSQEEVMTFTQGEHTLDEFLNYKADSAKPLPMIFQAGYLTVKGYDPEFEMYQLDFPNNEVRQGMITLLQQINDRGYAKAYEADPRPIYQIGASFSSKTGTIEKWEAEEVKK